MWAAAASNIVKTDYRWHWKTFTLSSLRDPARLRVGNILSDTCPGAKKCPLSFSRSANFMRSNFSNKENQLRKTTDNKRITRNSRKRFPKVCSQYLIPLSFATNYGYLTNIPSTAKQSDLLFSSSVSRIFYYLWHFLFLFYCVFPRSGSKPLLPLSWSGFIY